jgi:hypothetical protein
MSVSPEIVGLNDRIRRHRIWRASFGSFVWMGGHRMSDGLLQSSNCALSAKVPVSLACFARKPWPSCEGSLVLVVEVIHPEFPLGLYRTILPRLIGDCSARTPLLQGISTDLTKMSGSVLSYVRFGQRDAASTNPIRRSRGRARLYRDQHRHLRRP